MPTGGFLGLTPTARTTGNAGANAIFLTPLVAQQNGVATAILLDSFNANSSINLKGLIYDGSHSALLATGSTVTALVANYNRLPLTANFNLVAGTTYYVGYVCSAVCNVGVQASGGTASWLVTGQSVASPANPLVGGASNGSTLMLALELDGTTSAGYGFGPDQASGVTLSASNTVATFGSAANLGARSVFTHIPGDGKFYAEVAVGGTLNAAVGVGFAGASWGTNQGDPFARGAVTFLQPGGAILSGANLGLSYVSGDVIGIAYDGINNFLWWNKNNGGWFGASSTAGNPSTPTGGLATGTTSWPETIAVATGALGTAATFTLRDTAGALQYAPPSGYSAWSSAAGPVVGGGQTARVMVLA
jgi:hypothetical protein